MNSCYLFSHSSIDVKTNNTIKSRTNATWAISFMALLFETEKLYGSSHFFVTVKMRYAVQYNTEGIATMAVQKESVDAMGFSSRRKLITAKTGAI